MTTSARFPLSLAAVAGAALFSAAPSAAQGTSDAERRLGACLVSGSAGAPRDTLQAAVIAVRSLCHTQIRRVREERLEAIDAPFTNPDARRTAAQQEELERARDAAIRQLNDEIARVIAAQTGLVP